jgi:hypothetical protein
VILLENFALVAPLHCYLKAVEIILEQGALFSQTTGHVNYFKRLALDNQGFLDALSSL